MTFPEPQRVEDPSPEKYICTMDLSPLGQIIKSKMKLKLKISVCEDVRKAQSRHLKLNMASFERGGNALRIIFSKFSSFMKPDQKERRPT